MVSWDDVFQIIRTNYRPQVIIPVNFFWCPVPGKKKKENLVHSCMFAARSVVTLCIHVDIINVWHKRSCGAQTIVEKPKLKYFYILHIQKSE